MLIDPYRFQPVKIERIVRESERAVSVCLELPNGYVFEPGQHAVVRVTMPSGAKLVRQYSFSAPVSSGKLWLTVVQEPDGQVSTWFTETAKAGDTVEVSHPFTGPLVQKYPYERICMIAGGSGIAPLMAHIRVLRQTKTPFTLLYSTRSDERCFKDELTPLPGEKIIIRLTDTESRFNEEEITRELTKNSTVFICGSRPFAITMRGYCETVVPANKVYSEAFSL